jgi:hypothetical protein
METKDDAAVAGAEFLWGEGIHDVNIAETLYCHTCDNSYRDALELIADLDAATLVGMNKAGSKVMGDYLAAHMFNISHKLVNSAEYSANSEAIGICMKHSAMRFSNLEKILSEHKMKYYSTGEHGPHIDFY